MQASRAPSRRRRAARAALAAAALGCAGPIERPAPGSLGSAPDAALHAEQLATSVERVSGGFGNLGRMGAVRRRAAELGLGERLQSEWIDWFTLQRNQWIEIPGATPQLVYVVAHYDKVDSGPLGVVNAFTNGLPDLIFSPFYASWGAVDNATGVAVALELASALSASSPHFTYRVLLVGSEESGLRGSRAHVARLSRAEKDAIELALVIDTAGVRFSEDCVMNVSTPEARELAIGAARALGIELRVARLPALASSDFEPFQRTSFARDFWRGLKFNLLAGLLPQRSWFTGPNEAPVLFISACDLLSGRDPGERLSTLVPLPTGRLHGPRDRRAEVDVARLYRIYSVALRALQNFDARQGLPELSGPAPAAAPAAPRQP